MLKYLLLAVVVVWLFYSPALRGLRGKAPQARPPSPPPVGPRPDPHQETMVRCAHCGVHLPESDALTSAQGLPYCSATHRDAGPRQA